MASSSCTTSFLNLCPIFKGETDIFFIKNCDKINQAVPLLFIKLRGHAVLPLQFCKEPFYLFLFRLLLSDGISHNLVSSSKKCIARLPSGSAVMSLTVLSKASRQSCLSPLAHTYFHELLFG